jgi:pimeloyl-ACP methyl ester carboxylesterase
MTTQPTVPGQSPADARPAVGKDSEELRGYVVYLHGFASSANSSKATVFRDRFAPHGIGVLTPDFNEPDFEHLTVTRMLGQVDDVISALPAGPVTLIGSSLGAFVAVHAAARQRARGVDARIQCLVLLAPALDFGATGFAGLDAQGLARWKQTGRLDVFHYAHNRTMPLAYDLYEDASQYKTHDLPLDLPVLAFQGSRDTVVSPQGVKRWAAGRPNVILRSLDDDHQLLSSLEIIWAETFKFVRSCHVPDESA